MEKQEKYQSQSYKAYCFTIFDLMQIINFVPIANSIRKAKKIMKLKKNGG
jgi:hypothetical protein